MFYVYFSWLYNFLLLSQPENLQKLLLFFFYQNNVFEWGLGSCTDPVSNTEMTFPIYQAMIGFIENDWTLRI